MVKNKTAKKHAQTRNQHKKIIKGTKTKTIQTNKQLQKHTKTEKHTHTHTHTTTINNIKHWETKYNQTSQKAQ